MTVQSVPLLDLRRAGDDAELEAAFRRVLVSGKYILGDEVEAFEAECARACGARHAIGVSSGTDALLATLMALGVSPGDEVIVPAYTFIATATCAARVGATPVFADVMPCCLTLDAADVERKITRKTRAIIAVHLFGQRAHLDTLAGIARARDVPIIEDAAQAIGASRTVVGRAACLSFFPSKNIGALGDAGLVATDDEDLEKKIRAIRAHGAREHTVMGGNFRIDALQAALLRVKLCKLDEVTARRRANAARYDTLLAEAHGVELPKRCDASHVFNQYVIRSTARDALRRDLDDAHIGTAIYYRTPLHETPCFSHLPRASLPVSEDASKTTLALPIFPELSDEEIRYVASHVASSSARSK